MEHLLRDYPDFTATLVIVDSRLDPDDLLGRLRREHGLTPSRWLAKVGGTDTGPEADILHGWQRARALGLTAGSWIQCGQDPRADVQLAREWQQRGAELHGWCCEIEYKANAPAGIGDYNRAAELVGYANAIAVPQAVITYGKQDGEMDTLAFAKAGWPVLAEIYDGARPGDEQTYYDKWPSAAVNPLYHTLVGISPLASVYRPEGLL